MGTVARGRLALCAVAAASCSGLSGCAESTVDASVAWIEQDHPAFAPRVHVVDRGQHSRWRLRTDDALEGLWMQLEPRGQGLAVGSLLETVYIDFASNTAWPLGVPAFARGGGTQIWYPRNGDALISSSGGGRPEYRMVPLSVAGREPLQSLQPRLPVEGVEVQWSDPRSAAAAPVVMFTEAGARAPGGWVQALRYPVAAGGSVHVLGTGRDVIGSVGTVAARASWCPGGACVDPAGTTLIYGVDTECTVGRWTWRFASAGQVTSPQMVTLPDWCQRERVQPLAALSSELVLLEGATQIHLADLSSGSVQSLPRLDVDDQVLVASRGAVALLVGRRGTVIRADRHGLRLLAAASIQCARAGQQVAISPSGSWGAWACMDETGTRYGGAVVRVSPRGWEVYPSIPMRPLAVDDDGKVLLVSDGQQRERPGALYVLDSEARLERLDALHPPPLRVLWGRDGYFTAQAHPPW